MEIIEKLIDGAMFYDIFIHHKDGCTSYKDLTYKEYQKHINFLSAKIDFKTIDVM